MNQVFPPDIQLEIASHLNLPDIFNFILISSSFWKIGQSRSLWLEVLNRTRRNQFIARSAVNDLSQLGRDDLYRIAHRTHKLNCFWAKEASVSVPPVKSVAVDFSFLEEGEPIDILAAIPGTTLLIVQAHRTSTDLFCCDVGLDSRPDRATISWGTNILEHVHYDEHGRHRMAAISSLQTQISIIDLTYGNGDAPKMQVFCQLDRPYQGSHIAFLVGDVIAFPPDKSSEENCIFVTNFVRDLSYRISLDVPPESFAFATATFSVVGDTPFMILHSNRWDDYEVYRIPAEDLLLDHDAARSKNGTVVGNLDRLLDLRMVKTHNDERYNCPLYDYPGYTIWSAMGLQMIQPGHTLNRDRESDHHTHVCMWRNKRRLPLHDAIVVPLYMKGKHVGHSWSLSGTHAAVVLEQANALQLYVLRFSTSGVRLRHLDIPQPLVSKWSIAIDDWRGVIYVSTTYGKLFIFSYV